MRFCPPHEAKSMRKANAAYVFLAGLVIAAFVSIPIVNLATPIFAMAFMVHVHKNSPAHESNSSKQRADGQPFGRKSITRVALPSERSTVPGFTVRTTAVTPTSP